VERILFEVYENMSSIQLEIKYKNRFFFSVNLWYGCLLFEHTHMQRRYKISIIIIKSGSKINTICVSNF